MHRGACSRTRLQLVDESILDAEQFDLEHKGRIRGDDRWMTSNTYHRQPHPARNYYM